VTKTMLVFSIATALGVTPVRLPSASDTMSEIVALERKAMDGWLQGNPDPLLAMADADITYFHVMTEKRVDGRATLKALIEPFRGRALFDSYDMLEPRVQVAGDAAVLTYILLRRTGSVTSRWNATQIYQRKAEGWRVIHTHWSQTAPPPAPRPRG